MKSTPVETRREYIREVIKLKLWYAWRLHTCDGVDFGLAATKRVGICRLTAFGGDEAHGRAEDTEGWERVLRELREACERHAADATSAEIETEGLALLGPYLEPCIERDVAEIAQWLADSFGCFKYEYRPFYAEPDSDDHLTLHVRNAYQPDSPFQHLPEMTESLLAIVTRAERERPDVQRAQCATWLNSLPNFARLFPQSWTDTALPGQPGNHMGWWGQFMNRRGGYHAENARWFRESGQFPYLHRMCRCMISDLREHLSDLTANANANGERLT